MGTAHICSLGIRSFSSVNGPTNLFDLGTLLALVSWDALLLTPIVDCARDQVWPRRKLPLDLSNLFDFKCSILDVLLNPLHLGGWSSLRRPLPSGCRNIGSFMLRSLLRSLLLYLSALVLLILCDPWSLRSLKSFHLTVMLVSLWEAKRHILCLWWAHIVITEELSESV